MKKILKWSFDNIVPSRFRNTLRANHQSIVLNFHIRGLKRDPERYLATDNIESDRLLNRIIYGWGNPDWSVDASYLRACGIAARESESNILECGSGISTVVMAAVIRSRAIKLVALEHESVWSDKLNKLLIRTNVSNSKVVNVSLKSYGKFDWYDINDIDELQYSLVICDGPPASTAGGRLGLLEIMNRNMAKGCLILLDDCQREEELSILQRWSVSYPMSFEIVGDIKKYAVVKLSS